LDQIGENLSVVARKRRQARRARCKRGAAEALLSKHTLYRMTRVNCGNLSALERDARSGLSIGRSIRRPLPRLTRVLEEPLPGAKQAASYFSGQPLPLVVSQALIQADGHIDIDEVEGGAELVLAAGAGLFLKELAGLAAQPGRALHKLPPPGERARRALAVCLDLKARVGRRRIARLVAANR
jgi:hypothetical protein